MIGPYTQ